MGLKMNQDDDPYEEEDVDEDDGSGHATEEIVTSRRGLGGGKVAKTQKHVKARERLGERHCGVCDACDLEGKECTPAEPNSWQEKCDPCFNGKQYKRRCHHKEWMQQQRVQRWHELVIIKGKTEAEADCIVYGKLAVFAHPKHDKVPLSEYSRVPIETRRQYCRDTLARHGFTGAISTPVQHVGRNQQDIDTPRSKDVDAISISSSSSVGANTPPPLGDHLMRKAAEAPQHVPAEVSRTQRAKTMSSERPMPSDSNVRFAWDGTKPPLDDKTTVKQMVLAAKRFAELHARLNRSLETDDEKKHDALIKASHDFHNKIFELSGFRGNFSDLFGTYEEWVVPQSD